MNIKPAIKMQDVIFTGASHRDALIIALEHFNIPIETCGDFALVEQIDNDEIEMECGYLFGDKFKPF